MTWSTARAMGKTRRDRGIFLPWERRGAWLREMLLARRWKLVIGVGAALGAAWVVWTTADTRSRERATRESISQVQQAVATFRAEIGRCPRSIGELVHPPRSGARYLLTIPEDGWGRPLYVRCPGRRDPDGADVISAGESGSFFDDDNVQ